MGALMPQGPNMHCGKGEEHEVHPNAREGVLNAWCDGVPVLEPFLELVVRVPLAPFGFPEDMTMAELMEEVREEGIGTFVIDEMDNATSSVALRVRWGGEDRVYPVVKGGVAEGQGKLW